MHRASWQVDLSEALAPQPHKKVAKIVRHAMDRVGAFLAERTPGVGTHLDHWALHSRSKRFGIYRFRPARASSALAEPILSYGAEV